MPRIFGFNNTQVLTSFQFFQPDLGTTPTPSGPADTLTFTSSDGSIIITGNSSTDTLNFQTAAGSTTILDIGFTAGSVLFAGASGQISQNNPFFYWNNTNHYLGIGPSATAATAAITLGGQGTTAGIQFDSATNLYASASLMLKTDNSLTVVGNYYGASLTKGSLLFVGASGAVLQNNSQLFWDNSAFSMGIGSSGPGSQFTISNSSTNGTRMELENTSTGGKRWAIYSTGSANSGGAGNFALWDITDGGNFPFVITPGGNVGLGSLTPSYRISLSNGANQTIGVENATVGGGVAGRSLTLRSGDGDTSGSGSAGGGLSITSGSGNGDGSVARQGGLITVTAGNSKGTSQGGIITLTAGNADQVSGSTVTTGGAVNINGGIGAVNATVSGTVSGGFGGGFTWATGNGGIPSAATTTGTGGAGGVWQVTLGTGGTPALGGSVNNVGGQGGSGTLKGGQGGSPSTVTAGTNTAGSGGTMVVQGGQAGVSSNGATNNPASGGSVTVQGGSSAAQAGSSPGSVTVIGGTASSTGTGSTGANVNITASNANGDNTVNRAGGNVALAGGNSFGSSVGGSISGTSGSGGVGTGTAGAQGGSLSWTAGSGGAGSASGGVGGSALLQGGTGGSSTTPGTGGTVTLQGGSGSAGTGTVASDGGQAIVRGGTGANNATTSGNGANVVVQGGTGGTTGTPGVGGSIIFQTAAGASLTTAMTITNSQSIGIGATPGEKVEIRYDSVTAGEGTFAFSILSASTQTKLAMGALNSGAYSIIQSLQNGTSSTNRPLSLQPLGGRVGIGSTAPLSALTIGGLSTTGASFGLNFGTDTSANLYRSAAGVISTSGALTVGASLYVTNDISITTAGNGLRLKTGSNATAGFATLVAGSVIVPTTAVGASTMIFAMNNTNSGTPGAVSVSARTSGASFTITSTSATDTSSVAWLLINPA